MQDAVKLVEAEGLTVDVYCLSLMIYEPCSFLLALSRIIHAPFVEHPVIAQWHQQYSSLPAKYMMVKEYTILYMVRLVDN